MNRAVTLQVRLDSGETIGVAARAVFATDGALMRVILPMVPAHDPRERAARRLVARIDAELARPGAPGAEVIRREAELVADLAEQLVNLEAQHGLAMVRTAALEAGQ
jgi:hypothetical protein